jgi:preprotein translocase subunit SecD
VASSSTPVHPYRYLTLFLVLLIGAYLLVFLTGDKQAKPKLGIDLQGGTRVTLTARTPDGSGSMARTWSSPCPATTATRPATLARPRGSTSVR